MSKLLLIAAKESFPSERQYIYVNNNTISWKGLVVFEDFQYSTFTLFLPVFHKHPVILIYLLQRANHFPAWFVLGQFFSCSVYGSWLMSICSVKFLGLHFAYSVCIIPFKIHGSSFFFFFPGDNEFFHFCLKISLNFYQIPF